MASKTFLLFSLLSLLQFHSSAGQAAVKAAYWFSGSNFPPSDIDSTLFTHLFCAFADLNSQTKQVTISHSNNALFSQFTRTVQLKNPSVKTLLSIGGGGGNAVKAAFAAMASQPTSRKTFIDSSINQSRSFGFSGLDLDWEQPDSESGMANLGSLLSEWRAAVAAESRSSGNPPLILTAAVSNAATVDGFIYPTQSISTNLDWINVMAYDFHAPSRSQDSKLTNSHSALYDPAGQVSASHGIESWTGSGVNAKKVVLGLPFYGYAWRLVNSNNHGLLAPADGPDGPNNETMVYNQIRQFIDQNKAITVYNATIVSNYCYAGTTWIGYDDAQSVSAKVSYAKQKGLLGYFAWHLADDKNWALSQQAKQAWEA